MTAETERTLQLGRLGRTIGLDGGLLFHAAGAAEATVLAVGQTVTVEDHGELRVRESRRHNRGLVVHFEGIRRIQRARELTNSVVTIRVNDLPARFQATDLESGLLQLPVSLDGVVIGKVAAVEGASGFEYLRLEPGGQLLPLRAPYVQVGEDAIELLDPPDGLLQD